MATPSRSSRALILLALAPVAAALAVAGDRVFKWEVHDLGRPQPPVVTAGSGFEGATAPSDAIILFDGNSTNAWVSGDGKSCAWEIVEDAMVVKAGTGDIRTSSPFGDCQLHLEWMIPSDRTVEGQGGGNSGLFFLDRYELQILETHTNRTYADGSAGALYGQYPPLVNPCRPKGEWNVYDVVFRGPRFDASGALNRPATMTVFFNGVLVQDHSELLGATAHKQRASYSAHPTRLPIRLQDHGDPVHFRNIWVRPLDEARGAE